MRFFAPLILTLLMCIGSSVGQQYPPDPAAQLPEQGLATVYVYRLDEDVVVSNFFFWFRKTRPVYFSEQAVGPRQKNRKIAALRNKQYFMLRLHSGKYIFDTRSMGGHLELDVVAGGQYYLWVDQGNDCPCEDADVIGPPTCESRNASIVNVPPERWEKDVTVLRPIRTGDVKDRRLVLIPARLTS